jgi:transcriptional regulator GlxA family with amidase domain
MECIVNAPNKHAAFNVERHSAQAHARRPDMPEHTDEGAPAEFWVLLLPGFSQLCLSSLIEPLRLANALSGKTLFCWKLISLDGKSVESASGIAVEVTDAITKVHESRSSNRKAAVMICAGEDVEKHSSRELHAFLRRCVRSHLTIYALGTATWLLADAALLDRVRCTIHWGRLAALSEKFHDLVVDDALFVRDGRVVTCAGEFAAFDLAVDLVHERCGANLSRSICQHVTADRWREGGSCQAMPPGLRYGNTNKKLLQVLQLMEKNLEDPLSLEEIASKVSLSPRQIERLFERHLSSTPWQHYVGVRLARARQLLELTAMPVTDIAVACGFVSTSHFSKRFRDHFKLSPSKLRAAR